MKEIQLTQGYVALVDDEDYERVNDLTWNATVRSHTVYAKTGREGKIFLHRFVMNAPEGMQVDHKDRNGLNCQKSNLRLTNHRGNGQNRVATQGVNGSGFRGVSLCHRGNAWVARIRDNTGKKIHIGRFAEKEEAAKAYDEMAKRFHEEFAILNFPALDQSIPKTENNYYETQIGDAIDEPPPVNPIPDRKGESDETLDIEEYIEMSRDDADDIEADLQRRERNEDEID